MQGTSLRQELMAIYRFLAPESALASDVCNPERVGGDAQMHRWFSDYLAVRMRNRIRLRLPGGLLSDEKSTVAA